MPTTTPNSLRTMVSGSDRMPSASSRSFRMPRLDSSTSQPKARVRTEIQNGIRIQSSITSRCTGPPRTQSSVTT